MNRLQAEYKNLSKDRFNTSIHGRSQQYFSVYNHRVNSLFSQASNHAKAVLSGKLKFSSKDVVGENRDYSRQLLSGRSPEIFHESNVQFLFSTVELNKEEYEDATVAVVGTLFKEGSKKPNILHEYTRDYILLDSDELVGLHGKQSYISHEDQLFLEDNNGKLLLVIEDEAVKEAIFKRAFSGVVVTAIGRRDIRNPDILITQDIIMPGLPVNQDPLPSIPEDKFVAFVSGFEVDQSPEVLSNIQLIVRYLAGFLGSDEEKAVLSRICRLVIAGNSVKQQEEILKSNYKVKGSLRGVDLTSRVGPIQTIDHFLSKLAMSLEIDIMPGANDPSNISLPQQPINRCLLRKSSNIDTVNLVTNPYNFSLDGVEFLGMSSQAIDDILCYTEGYSSLDIAEFLILSSHLAPTAPDTLNSFPFKSSDPFVIEKCPHVVFVGGQTYGARWVQQDERRVLCLTIPKFFEERSIVLLNLRTLEPHYIRIEK